MILDFLNWCIGSTSKPRKELSQILKIICNPCHWHYHHQPQQKHGQNVKNSCWHHQKYKSLGLNATLKMHNLKIPRRIILNRDFQMKRNFGSIVLALFAWGDVKCLFSQPDFGLDYLIFLYTRVLYWKAKCSIKRNLGFLCCRLSTPGLSTLSPPNWNFKSTIFEAINVIINYVFRAC